MKKHVLFLAVGLLAFSGNVFASLSSVTFTYTTPTTLVFSGFTDNFTLPSFNPDLGTLEGVTINLTTVSTGVEEIINFSGRPNPYTGAIASVPLTITGPAGITINTTATAGPFAGTTGSGFGPYLSYGAPTTSSASANVAPGLFSGFETVNPVNLSVTVAPPMGSYSGSGQMEAFGGNAEVSGVTSVTYTYAPEPALLGVLSLGLVGIVLVRRKSLKNS